MPVEAYKEHIELTVMVGCKSQCDYCPQDLFLERYKPTSSEKSPVRMMTLNMVKEYSKSIPKELIISLAGFAEPLANPEIVEIYKYLRSEGWTVDMNTTLFNTNRKIIRGIMEEGLSFLQLHVADKNNLTDIVVDREYLSNLRYVLNVLQNKNTFVIVTCLGDIHPEVEKLIKQYECSINATNIGQMFINDRAGKLDNGLAPESRHLTGEVYCCKTYNRLHYANILPDGRVTLCCMDFGLENIIGDLNENSYKEIIEGEPANNIRKRMLEDDNDLICRNCEFAIQGKTPTEIPFSYTNLNKPVTF